MKKLLFSLIAISMFTFANAQYSSLEVINNTGLALKVDVGSRLAATAAGEVDNTQSALDVVISGQPVFNPETGDDYISRFQVKQAYNTSSTLYEDADPSDMIDVDADGTGEFEFDGETYPISFGSVGSKAVITLEPKL